MDSLWERCVLILAVCATGLWAQSNTGEIRLTVQDPSGAVMPASGKLQNSADGSIRTFETDAQGSVSIRVPAGRYRLELRQAGFALTAMVLDVREGQALARTVTMPLAVVGDRADVVAATPLAGVDLSRLEIPSLVQTATARDVEDSGALNLADFMNRRLDGVHINEIQGNPYQPDVNYRGYTASPLLGTPQGLSVYMDGVRLNQPFGDVVSWDLIPQVAISEVALMPGSNPLFGLNTLGGALTLETKDGMRNPGTSVQVGGGSFGRKTAQLEHGGSTAKGLSWFLASNLFFEDGWRPASPSDVRQFFGKAGWQRNASAINLSVSYANNALVGNGPQEQRLLARDYASLYTIPDITANRSPAFNLSGRHAFGNALSVSGNAYYRYIRTRTLNGDINEDSLDQSVYQPSAADIRALTAAGYSGFPTSGANASNTPFPSWRCIAQVLQQDEPAEKCNGLLNRTHSEQHNYGGSGQATWRRTPHHGMSNQFTAGAAFDGSNVDFAQSSQLGYLNPDRSVTGLNAFADGVTGGTVDGEPFDTRADLHGTIRTGSVYATDTLSSAKFNFTLSGRYNHTNIDNRDRIQPLPGLGSLTGDHSFGRFNPAAGFTYNPIGTWNTYFSYSEGSRAPTSIELGCADPGAPCRLPNALTGDPPLSQVVTRTFEAGVRGGTESRVTWSAGWFRAQNRDDILFVASTQTGFGYFKNFGATRRQGVEANVKGRYRQLSLGGGYTFLDATYQSAETVSGEANSTNVDGAIQIHPGNRIPLVPQHLLKAFAALQATSKLSVALDLVAASTSYARGNENNASQPDGPSYLGPGTSPGYGVVNLGARYSLRKQVELFVQINNLFDHHYYTGSQLGVTGITPEGTFLARPLPAVDGEFPQVHAAFYAPGAPFGAWGGIRVKF